MAGGDVRPNYGLIVKVRNHRSVVGLYFVNLTAPFSERPVNAADGLLPGILIVYLIPGRIAYLQALLARFLIRSALD